MNVGHLLLANLKRKRLRTAVTIASIATAFLLYTVLVAIRFGFEGGVQLAGADRLLMIHKTTIINPLPIAYESKVAAAKGVKKVTHASWFGGTYIDARNFFPKIAVRPQEYLDIYTEYALSDEAKKRWFDERTGAIIGRSLADRYNFKVGDTIPVIPDIWQKKGGGSWEFKVSGIYEAGTPGVDTTQMFFHYDYLDKSRSRGEGLVGWYIVQVDNPADSPEIATRLDAMFANSSNETKTGTEQAVAQSFANQIGDIGAIVNYILMATFFTILLIAGTTVSQSVRERTGELGVLKAIGFPDWMVLAMVVSEAATVTLLGAAIGFGLAFALLPAVHQAIGNYVPVNHLPPNDLVIGGVLALILGAATGLFPGIFAMRLRIVDALRRA
jgi:putative ABC transport system permease protein